MEAAMELRHLRYFVAVAEEGSLTLAAEKRLHTAQPSLSRQIRDLEYEVGVQLMSRSVHGIELTAAGRAFLDHARLALTQAEAAAEAARRAAQPAKPTFAMGFQTGQEIDWLPRATSVLRDELLNIEIRVSSDPRRGPFRPFRSLTACFSVRGQVRGSSPRMTMECSGSIKLEHEEIVGRQNQSQ
jgi:DNA-binding transcriptional LysR family regulator